MNDADDFKKKKGRKRISSMSKFAFQTALNSWDDKFYFISDTKYSQSLFFVHLLFNHFMQLLLFLFMSS